MYLLLLLTYFCSAPQPQTVAVNLSSSSTRSANIHLAVYATEEAFKAEKDLITIIEASRQGQLAIEVELPGPGRYVLAAYHDLNGNGKLDTNFFGAPSEPYGFNLVPPSKWRAPKFSELAADFNGEQPLATDIVLKKWKEY